MSARHADIGDRKTTLAVACATVLAGQAVLGALFWVTAPDAPLELPAISAAGGGSGGRPMLPSTQGLALPPVAGPELDVVAALHQAAAAAPTIQPSATSPATARPGAGSSNTRSASTLARSTGSGATASSAGTTPARGTVDLTMTRPPSTPVVAAPSRPTTPVESTEPSTPDEDQGADDQCSVLVTLVPRESPARCADLSASTSTTSDSGTSSDGDAAVAAAPSSSESDGSSDD